MTGVRTKALGHPGNAFLGNPLTFHSLKNPKLSSPFPLEERVRVMTLPWNYLNTNHGLKPVATPGIGPPPAPRLINKRVLGSGLQTRKKN
jgi:hypothetical protein